MLTKPYHKVGYKAIHKNQQSSGSALGYFRRFAGQYFHRSSESNDPAAPAADARRARSETRVHAAAGRRCCARDAAPGPGRGRPGSGANLDTMLP